MKEIAPLLAAIALLLAPGSAAQEMTSAGAAEQWRSPEGAFRLTLPEGWWRLHEAAPNVLSLVTAETLEGERVYRGCLVIRGEDARKAPFDWDYLNRDTESWVRQRAAQLEDANVSTQTLGGVFVASFDGITQTQHGRTREFVRTFLIPAPEGLIVYLVTCRVSQPEVFDMTPVNTYLNSLEFLPGISP